MSPHRQTAGRGVEEALRHLAEAKHALPAPAHRIPPVAARFSADLPDRLDESERGELIARAEALEPWYQGPFALGGDLTVGGAWRSDLRWRVLGQHVPDDLGGKRVLDIGCNAGYDPFSFKLRGAQQVVGFEPSYSYEQACFLESVYGTGTDFRRIGWQGLDAQDLGPFDLIHCNGVLYHEPNPMAMLQAIRPMLAEEGRLLLGSMLLAAPEHSEYARFVPGAFAGDRTWWWVPGRLALRWMMEAAGFRVGQEFGAYEGPRDRFPVITAYVEAFAGEPAPELSGETR